MWSLTANLLSRVYYWGAEGIRAYRCVDNCERVHTPENRDNWGPVHKGVAGTVCHCALPCNFLFVDAPTHACVCGYVWVCGAHTTFVQAAARTPTTTHTHA